ncbi:MAG: quinoprotein dehydrogenase-associated SoxYZ-like carrier [Xanthobacteraceae bacterium]|nr:quinoprotein dehydrogenase-associated SoxYZ-like carrier [Xanthobacteraceae bacterium]
MSGTGRRMLPMAIGLAIGLAVIVALAAFGTPLAAAQTPAPAPDETTQEADALWQGLVQDIFLSRPILDGAGIIALDMPSRAEDAAIVPVTLRATLPPGDERRVRAFTLVIDRNPSPMAARFEIGADAAISEISTRVRVNNYTNVHAVAELSDGKLYMTRTYVKASGGCSAPTVKNLDEARERLGKMRLRQFTKAGDDAVSRLREAELMIGHPNNSGLQMDQVTHLYVPAFFVNDIRIWQDDRLVLAVEGGISISEDPNIRFTYLPSGAKQIRAEAKDTDGHDFQGTWPVQSSGM